MKLITKRLTLRDIAEEDEKDLIKNINNLKVSRYLAIVPYPYSKKDAKWWINECKKRTKKKSREEYNFGIELKSKREIIGAVGLSKVDKFNGTTTLGY
jgi:RimJ/RimL family protein N-acetyltransferase